VVSDQWTVISNDLPWINHLSTVDHRYEEKGMNSKRIAWVQVYLWVGITALLFIMFVVAFSDERRIMAFLFPAWLDHLLSWMPLVHHHGFAFVMITIFGIGPFMKWLKERKEKSTVN
jgi:hypothetical protein